MAGILLREVGRLAGNPGRTNSMGMHQARLVLRGFYCSDSTTKDPEGKEKGESKLNKNEERKAASKAKLQSLLTNLKTASQQRKDGDGGGEEQPREPKLAKPKPTQLPKRDITGRYGATNEKEIGLETNVVEAAKNVAQLTKDAESTKSELLQKLQSISVEAKQAKSKHVVAGEETTEDREVVRSNMADMFSEIKVEKTKREPRREGAGAEARFREDQKKNLTAEQQAFIERRNLLRRKRAGREEELRAVNLFGGEPLGILSEVSAAQVKSTADQMLPTWETCAQRELRIICTPVPRNALEEMILWTDQGKLWRFPIDNEQDLEYSDDPFHKHVFLEQHLEPWCPKVGPIRHFMELVCVGLSKNPFMTSQKKLETIIWFKDYFEDPKKLELLRHQGAWHEEEDQISANN